MPRLRCILTLAFALLLLGPARDVEAAAEPPIIRKPRPAPAPLPGMPALPPAVIDPALAVEGEELAARKVETRLTVKVRLNGRGPYDFIVDSGADTSVVGLKVAHQLQLPLATPAILNAMASRSIVDRVRVDALGLGSGTVRNLRLPALREADLGGQGILGIDALAQQRLMMDFEKRTIRVEDARVPVRRQRDEIVVVGRRHRGQLILTEVRASGVRLDAIIDTGAQVTIGNSALRDRLIRRKRQKLETIEVTDVAGTRANVEFAMIDELRLGPVTLMNVPMAFADVPPFEIFGIDREPALLLGTDLLETFRRVSLDFRARKVRFQLRRCRHDGVPISTSHSTMTRLMSTGTADVCGR